MISYAKLYRNTVRAGLLAAALSYFPLTHAFTSMNPPLGWTGGGGGGGSLNIPRAGGSFSAGTWSGAGSLSAGGRVASIPATARLAAGAGRIAAAAAYAFPAARAAAAVAGWIAAAGFLYNAGSGLWEKVPPNSQEVPTDVEFFYVVMGTIGLTPQSACASYAGTRGLTFVRATESQCVTKLPDDTQQAFTITKAGKSTCPGGWYVVDGLCIQKLNAVPVSEPEFVDGVSANPMPDGVPEHIPVPLPINLPSVQPTFLPTGNPVPNPNYDSSKPQTADNLPFLQPGIRITGAPTTENPWQVDAQPVNRPVSSGEGNPAPVPETDGSQDKDKPRDDEAQDLCEKHPDILACAKVPDADTPGGDIPKSTQNIVLDQTEYFGSGVCPADSFLNSHGQSFKVWDWRKTCDFASSYVQPVFLVSGAFAALMIVLGGSRSS